MKKCGMAVICLAAVLVLGGCGEAGNNRLSGSNKVEDVINQQIAENDGKADDGAGEVKPDSKDSEAGVNEEGTDAAGAGQAGSDAAGAGQAGLDAAGAGQAGTDAAEMDRNAEQTGGTKSTASVDVDLTQMNSDMIYSTVFQMVNDPGSFRGKRVKMKGQYSSSWYDATNQYYNFILIADAAACCSQGLEFVWGDGSHSREEYPAQGEDIELVGTFDTYDEVVDGNTSTYCHLKDAEFIEGGK